MTNFRALLCGLYDVVGGCQDIAMRMIHFGQVFTVLLCTCSDVSQLLFYFHRCESDSLEK